MAAPPGNRTLHERPVPTRKVSEGEFVGPGPPLLRRWQRAPWSDRARRAAALVGTLLLLGGGAIVAVSSFRGGDASSTTSVEQSQPMAVPVEELRAQGLGCGRGDGLATGPAGATAPFTVFLNGDDVFVHSPTGGWSFHLTSSNRCVERTPAIRGGSEVSFSRAEWNDERPVSGVYLSDLARGDTSFLFETEGRILAQAWDPSGRYLASAVRTTGTVVRIWDAHHRRGTVPITRVIGDGPARLQWSPDGGALVHEDAGSGRIHVLVLRGARSSRTVIARGSGATWLDRDRFLYFNGPAGWWIMHVRNGSLRHLALPEDLGAPAANPSGRVVAFEDGSDIVVFEMEAHRFGRRITGAANPMWLDDARLVVTDTGSCDNCSTRPRIGAGMIIDVGSGAQQAVSVPRARGVQISAG